MADPTGNISANAVRRDPERARHGRYVLLALVLGVLMNYVVNLSVMLLPDWAAGNTEFAPGRAWPRSVPAHWPADANQSVIRLFGTTISRFSQSIPNSWGFSFELGPIQFFSIDIYDVGWPYRSLEADLWLERVEAGPLASRTVTFRTAGHPVHDIWTRGLLLPVRPSPTVVPFPLRPIWPGFALNSFLYAAVILAISVLPRRIRRFLRLRAGLCPRCKYPIGPSPVCTECGAQLPPRKLPA